MIELTDIAILIPTAILAGAVNSIAGGGTFFSFPILILIGLPPLIANTTNKVGIAIASLAGVAGFWRELKSVRRLLLFFVPLAILGSALGSVILLEIQQSHFERLVPWLLLGATLLFAVGGELVRRIDPKHHGDGSRIPRIAIGCGQFAIGIYGGFFAAGMGILMLALYELAGIKNIHEMNALKVAAALGINVISAAVFLLSGTVDWTVAIILTLGAMIGGYYGAVLSKKIPSRILRGIIVLYGTGMTTYFFLA